MVTPGSRLADIGTDHGFLPLYLLEQGRIPSALAMDVNKGPLMRAMEHIEANNCQQYIETRLSDGLKELQPGEADTVVIAGMGGGLMVRILTADLSKLEGVKELILQPQSELQEVRKCLPQIGYFIADEDMLVEDEKYYVVIRAVPAEKEAADFQVLKEALDGKNKSDVDMSNEGTVEVEMENRDIPEMLSNLYGPILLKKKHPVLKEWLLREIGISQDIIDRLSKEGVGEKAILRRGEVEEKQRLLKSALSLF